MSDAHEKIGYLRENLPEYAEKFIRIRPKEGGQSIPLVFNTAQMMLHHFIEDIKKAGQLVRVCVVKGRQQGVSTYTAARFLHKTTLNPGISVFILAHISKSTDYLFDMVKRMYINLPDPLRPSIERSNKKELKFGVIDSEYGLGTAGAQDVGRGMNPHLLHLSEAAFYGNTDDLSTGLMQGVATDLNTEIIMESTAHGVNNMFYNLCMKGVDVNALTRYKTLFIPWYIQAEYREIPPSRFKPSIKELELMELYNLTIDQIFWRRRKLEDEYNNDLWKFLQEYPCCLAEAFQSTGDTLLKPEYVEKARKNQAFLDSLAPMVMGVDGSGEGADRTVLVVRQGRRVVEYEVFKDPVKPMRLAGMVARKIDQLGLDMVFLDVAYGYGCRDRLAEMGYGAKTMAVHFGSEALMPELYRNKRAQMYGFLKDWFEEGGVSIPDEDIFVRDLLMVPGFLLTTSRGLLTLPPKDQIKKDNDGISPDIADALGLTFAFPVRAKGGERLKVAEPSVVRARSPFKARRLAERHVRQEKPSELYIKQR